MQESVPPVTFDIRSVGGSFATLTMEYPVCKMAFENRSISVSRSTLAMKFFVFKEAFTDGNELLAIVTYDTSVAIEVIDAASIIVPSMLPLTDDILLPLSGEEGRFSLRLLA